MRTIECTALVVIMTMVATGSALAFTRTGDENGGYEQRIKMKAQIQQARDVGGYPDPITALAGLFSGQLPENALQPGIQDPEKYLYERPALKN